MRNGACGLIVWAKRQREVDIKDKIDFGISLPFKQSIGILIQLLYYFFGMWSFNEPEASL